jgi:hypothetical protein
LQVIEQEQADDAPAEGVSNRARVDFTRTGIELVVDADPATAPGARNVGACLAVRFADTHSNCVGARVTHRVSVTHQP